jgi:heme-degrading monooxygenase HmoA
MIVVRNVFRLKFGKAKEVKTLFKEAQKIDIGHGTVGMRMLTDLTGPSYTYVVETTHKSLSEFENDLQTMFASKEWAEVYQKMIPLMDSGYREIFTVVD